MKRHSISVSTAVTAMLTTAVFAIASVAQPPQSAPAQQPAAGSSSQPPAMPAPSNLQVLPKNLTGAQVREIMEQWEGELGTGCSTCHVADPVKKRPNGRPMLNFPDDAKPEKATARVMVKMVETINTQFVGKIDSSGDPVTCGTCHRGHLSPEHFVPPPDNDGPPPAAATPPASH